MAATQTDIEIIQRETFTMTLTWESSDSPPVPIDLSGYRAHMQFRRKPGALGTPLLDATSTGPGAEITLQPGGAVGLIAVRLPATATASLTKNCWYDIFLIASADATEAVRLAHGQVLVDRSVTAEAS